MNARKKGSLKALSLENWFTRLSLFQSFMEGLRITNQEHEYWYGDRNVASKMVKEDAYNKVQYFNLEYLNVGGSRVNLSSWGFRPKAIKAMTKPEWPRFLHLASSVKDLVLDFDQSKMTSKDMELIAYAIGENPTGQCGIRHLNLKKTVCGKEGAKLLAPALAVNTSLIHLDLSMGKIGVSGCYRICESLKKNNTLKSLNLYRNILDVDGARSIGNMLKTNKSLEFLDIGHNRIRQTGLKAICDSVLTNKDCKLS